MTTVLVRLYGATTEAAAAAAAATIIAILAEQIVPPHLAHLTSIDQHQNQHQPCLNQTSPRA